MEIRSRHIKIFAVLSIVVSLTFSVIICEIILRVFSPEKHYVWTPGLRKTFRPLQKFVTGIKDESRFYINSQGIRGDFLSEKQTYKILAVGGSTTECLYLDELESWPHLAQSILNSNLNLKNSQNFWIGNIGRSGHTTRNHILQVRKLIEQYPDLNVVILLVGVNDFIIRLAKDEKYRSFPGVNALNRAEYYRLEASSFMVHPAQDYDFPFYKRTELWRRLRTAKDRLSGKFTQKNVIAITQDESGRMYQKWRYHRKSAPNIRDDLPNLDSALNEYVSTITEISNLAISKGVRVIFLTQPYMWRGNLTEREKGLLWMGGIGNFREQLGSEYYSVKALAKGMNLYNQSLLRLCQDYDFECIDLEKLLPKDTSIFYDDVHFNENGAKEVAGVVARYLAQNLRHKSKKRVKNL